MHCKLNLLSSPRVESLLPLYGRKGSAEFPHAVNRLFTARQEQPSVAECCAVWKTVRAESEIAIGIRDGLARGEGIVAGGYGVQLVKVPLQYLRCVPLLPT